MAGTSQTGLNTRPRKGAELKKRDYPKYDQLLSQSTMFDYHYFHCVLLNMKHKSFQVSEKRSDEISPKVKDEIFFKKWGGEWFFQGNTENSCLGNHLLDVMPAILALFSSTKGNTRGIKMNHHLSYGLSQLNLIISLSIILKTTLPSNSTCKLCWHGYLTYYSKFSALIL